MRHSVHSIASTTLEVQQILSKWADKFVLIGNDSRSQNAPRITRRRSSLRPPFPIMPKLHDQHTMSTHSLSTPLPPITILIPPTPSLDFPKQTFVPLDTNPLSPARLHARRLDPIFLESARTRAIRSRDERAKVVAAHLLALHRGKPMRPRFPCAATRPYVRSGLSRMVAVEA